MPLTWRELRDLTRLRRKQASTVRLNSFAPARDRIAAFDRVISSLIGFIPQLKDQDMWVFQCGRCYICAEPFTHELPATREHVLPRARGGKSKDNLLLACKPCNNIKGNRPPTKRELHLLRLYLIGDRVRFQHILIYNSPSPAGVAKRSKRQGLSKKHARKPIDERIADYHAWVDRNTRGE